MDRLRPSTLRWVSITSLFLAFAFAAAAHWQSASAANTQGTIQGFQFQVPASVTAGDTITWTNKDSAPHTVTSDTAGVFNVSVPAGESANMIAPAAGTYTFHCSIHPNMKATLVVAAAGTAPTATATSPAATATATSPAAATATATAPAPATATTANPGTSPTVAGGTSVPAAPAAGNAGSAYGGSGSYSSGTLLVLAAVAGLIVVVAGGAVIYRRK